jgi:N-acetylneuraminate synthase
MMFDKNPYFIAEISANHLGQLSIAKELVHAAAESGADAVKLQTYSPSSMTLDSELPQFKVSGDHPLWGGRKLWDLYQEAQTPLEWHVELFALATSLGLEAFSTPFDEEAVDALEQLEVPAYKVASLEIVDHPLIERIAATKKPMLLSTGGANLSEIFDAVETAKAGGATAIIPLVCTSSYPAQASDANLRRIPALSEILGVPIGLSDHTLGIGVSLAGIALGASVIEKHLTLRRASGGADSAFSMEPHEFLLLTTEGRAAYSALGTPRDFVAPSELESRRLRPSLWVVRAVTKGERVSSDNTKSLRPSGGLHPKMIHQITGKTFNVDLPAGTPLSFDVVS